MKNVFFCCFFFYFADVLLCKMCILIAVLVPYLNISQPITSYASVVIRTFCAISYCFWKFLVVTAAFECVYVIVLLQLFVFYLKIWAIIRGAV